MADEPLRDIVNFTLTNMKLTPSFANLTINATSEKNESYIDDVLDQFTVNFNFFYTPILIILGCIGNILSLIVFILNKLRSQSTSQYLTALSISDTIFLLQLLPPWLNANDISSIFITNGFCQSFVYLSYASSTHSTWVVVSFTVERFVAVVYPLQRNSMCTAKRSRYIILVLILTSLGMNLPVLVFAKPRGEDCNVDLAFMKFAARFNVADTVLSFTFPLAIIVILNVWIMVGVCRLSRTRDSLMTEERVEAGVQTRPVAFQRSQQRVTKMLLIVSSVFVLLNLPAYTMRIIAYAHKMNEKEYVGRWAAIQQICLLFFHTNFGINFFLYCMSGQNFRRALCQSFPCLRRFATPRSEMIHMRVRGAYSTASIASNNEATTSFIIPPRTDGRMNSNDAGPSTEQPTTTTGPRIRYGARYRPGRAPGPGAGREIELYMEQGTESQTGHEIELGTRHGARHCRVHRTGPMAGRRMGRGIEQGTDSENNSTVYSASGSASYTRVEIPKRKRFLGVPLWGQESNVVERWKFDNSRQINQRRTNDTEHRSSNEDL